VRSSRAKGGEAVLGDGQGIDREDLPHLFELFYQVDSTADRTSGGLGIGLTLVRRLARLHGGDAEAQSEGRDGSTFTARLPAVAAPEPAPRASRAILVVEDQADARASLRVALELTGYRVVLENDGPAALDVMRRERPRIAVLDIGLPGMDG
jgi:two-component system, sensor histidine kinase